MGRSDRSNATKPDKGVRLERQRTPPAWSERKKSRSPKGQCPRRCRSPSNKGRHRQPQEGRQEDANCYESSRSQKGQHRPQSSRRSGHGKRSSYEISSDSSRKDSRRGKGQEPPLPRENGKAPPNPLTKDVKPQTWLARVLAAQTQQEALEVVREELRTTRTEENQVEMPSSSGDKPHYIPRGASPKPKSSGKVTTTTTQVKMRVMKSPAKLQRDKIRLLRKKLEVEIAKQNVSKKNQPAQQSQETKKKELAVHSQKEGQKSKEKEATSSKAAAIKKEENAPMQVEDPTGDEDESSSESLI